MINWTPGVICTCVTEVEENVNLSKHNYNY